MEPTQKGDRLALALVPDWPGAATYAGRLWCAQVVRLAVGIDGFNVVECNRESTDAEKRRDARRRERLGELVRERGKEWGVYIQNDPRGVAVRLLRPRDRKDRRFIPPDGLPVEVR